MHCAPNTDINNNSYFNSNCHIVYEYEVSLQNKIPQRVPNWYCMILNRLSNQQGVKQTHQVCDIQLDADAPEGEKLMLIPVKGTISGNIRIIVVMTHYYLPEKCDVKINKRQLRPCQPLENKFKINNLCPLKNIRMVASLLAVRERSPFSLRFIILNSEKSVVTK